MSAIAIEITAKTNRPPYAQDGLFCVHDWSFQSEPAWRRAFMRAAQATEETYYVGPWRVHIALWCASLALRLEGAFVECGVNRGFMSTAVMEYTDWNSRDRDFYLLDRFAGGGPEGPYGYVLGSASVRKNFSEWDRVYIIEGAIPETLPQVTATQVAYLHIDMNCAEPEIAALNYFWDRLTPGAVVLLDDYAYDGYETQKTAMDEFAKAHDALILSLPTGQGLIIR